MLSESPQPWSTVMFTVKTAITRVCVCVYAPRHAQNDRGAAPSQSGSAAVWRDLWPGQLSGPEPGAPHWNGFLLLHLQ